MKYKEFNNWCNQRAADGCWGLKEAMTCIDACHMFSNIPFWKRERIWRESKSRAVLEEIVTETNKIIDKMRKDSVF